MIQITMRIIEQLLNGSGTEDMLSDGLELLGNTLQSDAGAILIPDGNWLHVVSSFGPVDLTDLTVECGGLLEESVIRTGKTRIISRGEEKDRIESAGDAFQEKVRQGFIRAASEDGRIVTVDASLSPDEIFAQIREKIEALI